MISLARTGTINNHRLVRNCGTISIIAINEISVITLQTESRIYHHNDNINSYCLAKIHYIWGLHRTREYRGHRLVWSGHWPSMQNAKLARNPGSNPGDRMIHILLILLS